MPSVAVFLPISPHQVIVGSIEKRVLNFSELRRKIAACSLEYFIANEAMKENEGPHKLISREAPLATTSEIEKLVEDFMTQLTNLNRTLVDSKNNIYHHNSYPYPDIW